MGRTLQVSVALVVGAIVAALVFPLVVPIPPLEDTVQPKELAGADSRFIDLDGLQIHLKSAGSGQPTLVLLHGFAASLFTWRDVLPRLGAYGSVLAYDRPAFGLTSRPMPGDWEGDSPYSTKHQAELLIRLLDRFGVDKAILVGNSAGGTVALLAALRYPTRLSALVLVDAAVYAGSETPGWLSTLLQTPQARRLGPFFVRAIASRGRELGRAAWHDPSRFTEEVWAGYAVPLHAENWDRGLWELVAANRSLGLIEQLGTVAVPTLVITGDDDRVVPTADSIRLAGAIPGARLAVLENCGHVPQEECPDAFMRALTPFIESVQRDGSQP